jgi:hypothetical protein
MAITVWCPHPGCGQEFDVRDAARGLEVPCPACHRNVPIAAPAEPPPLPQFLPPRQPLAPPPLPPQPGTRSRRRRFGGVRRAFGRRPRAASRFGRDEPKSRHGCVTAWLVLIIVLNALFTLAVHLLRQRFPNLVPPGESWQIPVSLALCLANIVCAVALLNWKRWGFYGICAISATAVGINLYLHASMGQIVGGVIPPLILLIVLQFGDRKTTWSQLE